MGTKRRQSDRARRVRATLRPDDRDTLLPCAYCQGVGSIVRNEGSRYRQRSCCFCDGNGCVEPAMLKVISRWLSIRNRARLAGRCGERPPDHDTARELSLNLEWDK